MSTRALVAAMATIGLLSGCTALGIEENTFRSTPLPAIGDDQAEPVLAALDGALNEANAARDPALLATVVADPLLAIDSAGYALDTAADPENTTPLPDVSHTDPTVFVPRFDAYPQWFLSAAAVGPDTPLRLEVLSRDASAASWLLSFSTDLLTGVEFPVLALDDAGYVLAVDEAAAAVTARSAADAQVAALTGAEPAAASPDFAEEGWTVARRAIDAQRGEAVVDAATVEVAYEVTDVLPQALSTSDGGTIVLYTLTEDVVYRVQPTYFLQLDEATAALVGTEQITSSLSERWAIQMAVYVPPEPAGAARVVGARVDRMSLTGS